MGPKSKAQPPSNAAFLRQLKDAAREPGFRPGALLGAGSAQDKADSIQGFLNSQRKRTGASTAKSEWLLAAQQLQDESVLAEKDLLAALQSIAQRQDSAADDETASTAAKAVAELHYSTSQCQSTRAALRLEIKGLQEQMKQLGSNGRVKPSMSQAVQRSFQHLKEHLQQQLLVLAEEEQAIGQQAVPVEDLKDAAADDDGASSICLWPAEPQHDPHQGHALSAVSPVQDSVQQEYGRLACTGAEQAAQDQGSEAQLQSELPPMAGFEAAASAALVDDAGQLLQRPSQSREPELAGQREGVGKDGGMYIVDGAGVGTGESIALLPTQDMVAGQQQLQQPEQQPALQRRPSDVTTSLSHDMVLLDEVVLRYPLAGDATKARARMVYYVLRQRYHERLETWQAESDTATAATLKAAGMQSDSGMADGSLAATGGWPADEHSLFVSHRLRCCQGRAGRGKAGAGLGVGAGAGYAGREALIRQLAALMPNRTMAQLIAHDDWLTTHKLMQRKRRDLLEAWHRERNQFLEDSAALLQEAHTAAGARAAVAADRLAHELERERRHDKLRDLQEQAVLQDAAVAASMAVLEAEAAQQAAATAASEAERMAHNKQLISAYRSDLQLKLEADALASAQIESAAEAGRVALAAHNQERVQWRKAEYLVKQDRARAVKDQASAEAAAREARLDRLRALVAPQVEADPTRALQPTESWLGVDEKTAGAFKDVHGFTTEQVFKDSRVKLMAALQQAGLHNTEYGRQAIQAAAAATHTRVDNLTFAQRKQ